MINNFSNLIWNISSQQINNKQKKKAPQILAFVFKHVANKFFYVHQSSKITNIMITIDIQELITKKASSILPF
jgi:hypothetical protein